MELLGPLALGGIAIVVGAFLLRSLVTSAGKSRSPVMESDGHEVFRGTANEVNQVIHTLADAGISAWSEGSDDGTHAVFVDQEQHAEVPALLAVQKQIIGTEPMQP